MPRAELPAILGVLALLLAPPVPPIRYTSAQLDCARFHVLTRSDIETSLAGRRRRETVEVEGRWIVRAEPATRDSARLEAWFDTLAVWRRGPEGTLAPDTDGLIGGRYGGELSADGHYVAETHPFVPDDLAQVVDLSDALGELLPPVPGAPLAVGGVWRDTLRGVEIRRLTDSAAASGAKLGRYKLAVRREATEAPVSGDSQPIPVHQTTHEDGEFVWDPDHGFVRRKGQIVVETDIPTSGRVRRAVRSRVEQHVVVERLSAAAPCPARSAAQDRIAPP
ncbi:MAG TPA: hypothetical protein VFW66_09210 [Gemmatimonadales bacterium]|nr:hypothetical protein [Gemmatimonadales bacterium]